MNLVSLVKKENYENLDETINILLNDFDFSFLNESSKVFIKLNCVGPFDYNLGITTHPVVLESIIKFISKYTTNIIVGDNPATKDIVYVLKKCGLYEVISKYNLKILNQKDIIPIKNSTFKYYQNFSVSREMIENDLIINLPKLKTHGLTYMTCAVKNFFGLIYGLEKASWHSKASNPLMFKDALCDLYGALIENHQGRILSICDGIIALDGDGPATSGITKSANCLLASFDCVSLDYVACLVVKLDPKKLIITNGCFERGYSDINNIQIINNNLEDFDVKFIGPSGALPSFGLKILKIPFFRNLLLEYPIIQDKKCIKCKECAKICPMKIIKPKKNNLLIVKKRKCIRCFCCIEVCPVNAIKKSKQPLLASIFFK